MSIVILNVASKKKGKTTKTKQLLNSNNLPKFIYDVNKEYKEFGKGAVFMDFEQFLKEATKKVGHAIVFEEAFIFLSHHSQQKEMKELLVRTRHTKNFIILNFHAVHQIPMWVLDFVNFLIIGKTNDKLKWMLSNYSDTEILEAWQFAQEHENVYCKVTLELN